MTGSSCWTIPRTIGSSLNDDPLDHVRCWPVLHLPLARKNPGSRSNLLPTQSMLGILSWAYHSNSQSSDALGQSRKNRNCKRLLAARVCATKRLRKSSSAFKSPPSWTKHAVVSAVFALCAHCFCHRILCIVLEAHSAIQCLFYICTTSAKTSLK